MICVVIDTNVLVSAFLSRKATSATVLVLENMFEERIRAVYNEEILDEYNEVLRRAKFGFREADIVAVMNYIAERGLHADKIPFDGDMPDEKDRAFYEVSLNEECSYLVTGNLKHFPVAPKVVSPAELIAILRNR